MAPKTSMAGASRVAGICFGKACVRMASAEKVGFQVLSLRQRSGPSALELGRPGAKYPTN
jgi:hypothetical protein